VRPVAADVPPPRGGQRSTERGSRNDLLDDDASGTVRPIRAESDSRTVRPVSQTTQAKPFVLTPTGFNDAQSVGDRFKAKQPVIVNLQAADRDLARRLIDFASGLCYGLGGQMEKVATQVYLLTPADVELSAEARRQIVERRGSPAADS
jgi:cell division inhibitor SepF